MGNLKVNVRIKFVVLMRREGAAFDKVSYNAARERGDACVRVCRCCVCIQVVLADSG